MTLTSEYQYIGRSNAVSCPAGWQYYTLLYAKTTGDPSTGKHTVSVKMRMACDVNSSFYYFDTGGFAKVDGASAFSWEMSSVPLVDWETSRLTEGGYTYPRWVELKEGSVEIVTGFQSKAVTIESSWVNYEHEDAVWAPYTYQYATASIEVTLPMIACASKPSVLGPSTTLIILSDTKTIDQPRAIAALREAQRQAGKVIWLNPIPERHWKHIRSVQTFASLCSMVCCSTLQSLAAACRKLTQI